MRRRLELHVHLIVPSKDGSRGARDWLYGETGRATENHQLSSTHSFLFGPTSSGRTATERGAIQITAAYSCVRLLAEVIVGLPSHVYKSEADGSKSKAVEYSLYRLLNDEPTPEMTSFVFRERLTTHLNRPGFGSGGQPEMIDPSRSVSPQSSSPVLFVRLYASSSARTTLRIPKTLPRLG